MAYAVARKEREAAAAALDDASSPWCSSGLLPDGRLWNARVLPFFYMSVHLWAAYGATWLVRPFTVMIHDLFGMRGITARRIYVPVVAIVLGAVVIVTSTTAAGWIKWNYSGYEGKANWPQYKEINDFLDTLAPGRVMVEHNQKLDEFGTPRAFEIIPYWTEQPTMEGTLMEASFTAPFHFINQAELSKEASNAIIGVDYPGLDVPSGITHLQLMNIPYFLTFTAEVTAATKADPGRELLATFGDYNVFRISGTTGYVEVMKNEPVRVDIAAGRVARHGRRLVPERGRARHPHRLGQRRGGARSSSPPITPEQAADPAGGAHRHRGARHQRDSWRTRASPSTPTAIGQAALDQDLVLPQLARGGSGGAVPGVAVVHDGHPHRESRDPHLRPHRGQHRGPDAGSPRLGAAGRAVGVALHPLAPAPQRWPAVLESEPGASPVDEFTRPYLDGASRRDDAAAEPGSRRRGRWRARLRPRSVARGDDSEGQQYLWPDDRIAGADEEDVGGVVDEADRPGAGDEGLPSAAAGAEEAMREET